MGKKVLCGSKNMRYFIYFHYHSALILVSTNEGLTPLKTYATQLWYMPHSFGICHTALVYATQLWYMPHSFGVCHTVMKSQHSTAFPHWNNIAKAQVSSYLHVTDIGTTLRLPAPRYWPDVEAHRHVAYRRPMSLSALTWMGQGWAT